jgi:hypothetical protein
MDYSSLKVMFPLIVSMGGFAPRAASVAALGLGLKRMH